MIATTCRGYCNNFKRSLQRLPTTVFMGDCDDLNGFLQLEDSNNFQRKLRQIQYRLTSIVKHFQCRVVVFQSPCYCLPVTHVHAQYFFTQQVYKRLLSFILGNILSLWAVKSWFRKFQNYHHFQYCNHLLISTAGKKKPNRGPWATSLIWTTFKTQIIESSGLLFKHAIFVYQLTSISPVISHIFYHVSPYNSSRLKS